MTDYNKRFSELQKEAKDNGFLLAVVQNRKTVAIDGIRVTEEIVPSVLFVKDDRTKQVESEMREALQATEQPLESTKAKKSSKVSSKK